MSVHSEALEQPSMSSFLHKFLMAHFSPSFWTFCLAKSSLYCWTLLSGSSHLSWYILAVWFCCWCSCFLLCASVFMKAWSFSNFMDVWQTSVLGPISRHDAGSVGCCISYTGWLSSHFLCNLLSTVKNSSFTEALVLSFLSPLFAIGWGVTLMNVAMGNSRAHHYWLDWM